ncbi:MAG TPA: carboxypeptidase-like regulatory domain-containing protein, partial [Candidatus Saccharimonadia bacterium]|nr:carboxypeptidase-like regulatory domain-containing protein [Candidatus Saccharimonadia bacterium]
NESTSTASSPPKNTETPPQTTTQSESAPTAADLSTPTAQAKSAPTAVDLATPGFLITSENRVVLKAGTFMPMPAPREGMATDEIGGVVVDEDGKMVANAEVHVRLYRRAAGEKNPDSVKSDAQGRWTMKGIPQGRQVSGEINEPMTGKEFKVTASHPDYLSLDLYHHTPSPGPKTADFRNGTAVLIMETGLVMKGRVTDKAGKPVAKAKIRRGFQERNVDDPTTMTDAEGNYELKHARAGDFRMRIEAKDCAVWMGRVEFHESGMQNFTLDPARTLTVRVLDDKGQPIPKAYAVYQGATKEDHGGGSIAWGTVDAEGKYSWAWTPPRNVTVNISHEAYQDKKVAVKESETEVTVTLQPRHRLTLKMVDATTGKAVPDCKVERGQTFVRGGLRGEVETAWPPNPPRKADAQGLLEDTLREKGELVAYRITSPGYTPLISRVMSEADSNTTQELKLQPTKELVVQLQQPDGSPAPGAHVYALLRTTGFVMQSLKDHVPVYDPANSRPLEASLEADAQGACTLPAFSDDTVIIVVHGSGFASAYWKDLPRGTGWKLEPWARAEGMVREAGKPVAGVEYEYQGSMPLPGQHWVSISLKGTSDAQGKIVMPRVFPAAQAHFAEVIRPTAADIGKARDRGSFSQRVQDYEMKVTRSGETTHFDLTPRGDKSWMVLGRFVTESGPIPENRMPRGFLMDKELTANASRSTFNMANLNRDGTFEIGPLTPGEYRLQLWDQDKPNFTLKSPLLVLPEVPHGATTEQRRRDIGDVVLLDNSSKDNLLQVPEGRVRFRVTVTDTDGKPLPGASIKPVAYRVKENSGTAMDAKNAAPDFSDDPVRTDASGVAEIECGAKTKDGNTLTELQLYVVCDGHVGNYAFFARANVKSAVPLRRAGTVIAKITREGKPVDSDRVHITSSKASTDADEGFIREADGTQVNRCLREGPLLVQAAWKSNDGRLLYSKTVPVTVALDKPATCHLELEPGQHLKGRLDAQVPRPVKNARIGVCVLNVLGDVSSPRISWNDWQDVREDGTFDFPSLPPGQIHVGVLAEGWMHTYEPDAWSIVHPLPLTAPLPDEVVIPMARTYSCEVLVLGKDGQPLPGVNVSASPSLNWDGRGNGFLDIHGPRLDQVLDKPVKAASGWDLFLKRWRTYDAVTDAEGRVTISGLPSGVQNFYALTKPWKPGEGFTPMTHGQSDAIGVGKMGKVILRVQK